MDDLAALVDAERSGKPGLEVLTTNRALWLMQSVISHILHSVDFDA